MNTKGFTLIELLVVVLIIGVLSAVALPQYTKSVEKSRAIQAITLVKSVKDAAEVYWLANGSYPANLTDLDVEVPETLKDFYWDFSEFSSGRFALYRKGTDYYAIIYSGQKRQSPMDPTGILNGILYCSSRNAKGKEFCRSIGKTKVELPHESAEFWAV